MKIKFCIFYFFLFNGILVFGQAPEIEWELNLGGTNSDWPGFVTILSDSGYIISGYSRSDDNDISFNHGGADYWIVKLDSLGNLEWQKTYGGSETDYGGEIIELNDGYLITGVSISTDGDITDNLGMGDGWIIKIDFTGNIQWQKSYGGTESESINSIIQLDDGSFVTAGYTYSSNGDCIGNHGDADFWVMRIDSIGNKLWSKCFGGSGYDDAFDLCQLSSAEILVCGGANSSDGDLTLHYGYSDFWVIKLTPNGDLIWEKTYGGTDEDIANAILQSPTGKIYCVGETNSNDYDVSGLHSEFADFWFIEIDTDNTLLWQKCFGGTGAEEAKDMLQQNNDEIIITGVSSTNNDGDVTGHHGASGFGDFWIMCADTIGIIKWETSLGGTETDFAYSISNSIDTGLLIAGYSLSNDGDVGGHFGSDIYSDYWIVKLDKPCKSYLYYQDTDGDLFGDSENFIYSCFDTIGFVFNNSDCNDLNPSIYWGAPEICNNIDDNCDGNIDEDIFYYTYFEDADNDDYGNINNDSIACALPEGYVESNSDCDDTNPSIYPGAPEILNGLDDNCNGFIDEGLEINNALLSAVKIYPNPASDQLFIETGLEGNFEIEIFDTRGKIVFNSKFNSNTNISLINFSSGIYFMKIISENGFAGINFVKE